MPVGAHADQEAQTEVSNLEAHINRIGHQSTRQDRQGKSGTPTIDTMNKIITPTKEKTTMKRDVPELPDAGVHQLVEVHHAEVHQLEIRDIRLTKDLETETVPEDRATGDPETVPSSLATGADVTETIRGETKARRNLIEPVGPAQALNLQARPTIGKKRKRAEVTRKVGAIAAHLIPTRLTTAKERQEDKDFKFPFITILKQRVPVKI